MADLTLVVGGLCALGLRPCNNNPNEVTAIFPDAPKHTPNIYFERADLYWTEEPDDAFTDVSDVKNQFVSLPVEGDLAFEISRKGTHVLEPLGFKEFKFVDLVADLAKVVPDDDMSALDPVKVKSAKARLRLPYIASKGAVITAQEYDVLWEFFPKDGKENLHHVANQVTLILGAVDAVKFTYGEGKQKTLILKDGGKVLPNKAITIYLASPPQETTDDKELEHFHLYYDLALPKEKKNIPGRNHVPRAHTDVKIRGLGQVGCAICRACYP